MGLRRHVPDEQLDLYLRQRVPGGAHRRAPELVQGCCSYGAHLIDKKDARRVEKAAATLTPEEWQNHRRAKKGVIQTNKHGETVTRLVGDACIFLNGPGFPAGAGCAFHIAALRRGVNPMTLKPEVCWQLPLRREDQVDDEEGHVTSVIRQWDRRHWGKGGREFHWWCTEAPDAFVGSKPVYEEMQAELTKMVGAKVYEQFVALVKERERRRVGGRGASPSRGADSRCGCRGAGVARAGVGPVAPESVSAGENGLTDAPGDLR